MGCGGTKSETSENSVTTKQVKPAAETSTEEKTWAQKVAVASDRSDDKTSGTVPMKVQDADEDCHMAPTVTSVVPAAKADGSKKKKTAGVSWTKAECEEEAKARKSEKKPDRATRKSMSANKAKRQTMIFGPSGPKAQTLAQLLCELQSYQECPPLDSKIVDEKKAEAKELADEEVKPCACSLFFFQVDTDKSGMLDRAELQLALWRIPGFNNALFDYKIAELFSEGDGWLDLDEWIDLAEELPDLKAAVEQEPICCSWRDLLQ